MMVAERATAPCSEQSSRFTTPEPSPATCAFCCDDRNVYRMGDKWICEDHLKSAVALAACDVWPNMVRYTREFEAAVLM